jgi:hypothetical protein
MIIIIHEEKQTLSYLEEYGGIALFNSCVPEKIADYIEFLLHSNFPFRKCKVSCRVLATEF